MCPDQATLRMYLDEELPVFQMEALTKHVDDCASCQKMLDDVIAASTDADIVNRIRAVTPAVLTEDSKSSEADAGGDSTPPTQMIGAGELAMVPRFAVRPQSIPGYDIQGEIGRGGMGVVYRALHRRLGRTVALKLILAGGMVDPRIVQRFLFEAEILGRVKHSQIVQVYEMSITSGHNDVSPDVPYIAMELLEGGTLAKAMNGQHWEPRAAAKLVEGLARALHTIHTQGIIHRDIKPANILATEAGLYKLTDFGLAKSSDQHDCNLTATGVIMGTPNYMSPEQAAGSKFIGPATDIYSLGAILFELLAGRPPFGGGEPMALLLRVVQETPTEIRSIRNDVPADLAAITMKCLAKEPERRYSSAENLASDLERFLTNRPTRAKSVSTLGRLRYWAKRNPAMATMLSTLALVLVAAFVSVFLFWLNAVAQAKDLKQALDRADRLTGVANKNAQKANELQAERTATNAVLAFDVAVSRCERGDVIEGIEQFLKALRMAQESKNPELERVIRANLDAWSANYMKVSHEIDTTGLNNMRCAISNQDGNIHVFYNDERIQIYDQNQKRIIANLAPGFPVLSYEWFLNKIPIINSFAGHKPIFHCAAISPDSSRLVLGNHSGLLYCFKMNGQLERTIRVQHQNYTLPDIWDMKFSNKNELWVCGSSGIVNLYNIDTGKLLNNVHISDPNPRLGKQQPERNTVMSIDVSADGKTIVVGDRIGRVQEWKVERGAAPQLLRTRNLLGWVNCVAYSHNGRYLAATGTMSRAIVWDRQRNDDVPKLDIALAGNYGSRLSFSHDDVCLAVNEVDAVRLWDVRTGVRHGRTIYGSYGKFIPKEYKLLVTRKGSIAIYDVPNVPSADALEYQRGQIRDLAFSPDGKQLAVIKNGLYLFDRGQFASTTRLPSYNYLTARTVKYSEDGTRLVVGLTNSWTIIDRNSSDLQSVATNYISHDSIAVHPKGERIWTLNHQHLICWKNDGKTQISSRQVIPLDFDRRDSIGFVHVPKRQEIVLWYGAMILIIPDDLSKNDVRTIHTSSPIRKLVVSSQGEWLLSGHRDATLQLWNYDSGKSVHQRRMSHTQDVSCVAFAPDETKFVSGSRDGTVQIWDRATALPLGPRCEVESAVLSLATSPEQPYFVTGTTEGIVRYHRFIEWQTQLSLEALDEWFLQFKRYGSPLRPSE